MSILALAPPHYFVRSFEVALLYFLVAALPPITVRLRRSSGVVRQRIRFRVVLAYVLILIVTIPGLLRLAEYRGAVAMWLFECAIISIVSGVATFVFSRRKKKDVC